MLRTLLLAALVLAPAVPPQEETLDQVIEKWDAASAALRPLRLSFDKTGTPGPADVEADRDGNVRVALHPYYGRTPDGAPMREWFLAPRGLHVIDHLPTIHPSRGVPIRRAERLDPAAGAEHDPTHFPNPQAVQGVTLNESAHGIFLLLLSPRRALAFERNLQLLGRRDLDGEPCWILRAEKTLSFQSARQVRRFFISVRDHRLRRVDQVFRWPRAHHGDRSLWTFTYGDGPLPMRLQLATTRNPFEGDWDLAAAKRDPPAGPIAPPDDLYATRARFTNVAELAAASPDDPEILASLAIQRGDVADWEKVVARSPHETPRLNLLRIAAGAKATDKVLKLADAVEKDPKATRPVILEAARALVQVGRSERSLPLLDRFGADPPDDARRLRVYAWKELKDLKKVMAESLPMILRKDRPQTWIDVAGLPDADVRREIDAAIQAHPESAALRLVRLHELARMKRIGGLAGAFRDCLAAKVDDDQLYFAVQAVIVMIRPHGGAAGLTPEVLAPAAKDLFDVLDPARSLHFRTLRFIIRHALDEKEEAEAELKLLMAEASKGDPKLRSYAWAYVTPDYKSSPIYEEAGRLALESMKGIPRGTVFAYHAGNPFDLPGCVYAQARARAGDFGKLFETLYGIDPGRNDGGSLLTMLQLRDAHLAGLGKVALETPPGAKDAHDRMIWAGRLLSNLAMQYPPRRHLPETRELFLKARELKPDSWPALEGLIETLTHDKAHAEAAALASEALERIAKSPTGARWSATRLRLILARNLMKSGDEAAARTELERIDPARMELDSNDVARSAEMAQALGLRDRAVALYERLVECGHRPLVRLANLYAEQGRAVEALRAIQEALDGGFDAYISDPDRLFVGDSEAGPAQSKGDARPFRDRLFEGPTGDAAIREWLGRKRAPPSEENARRARAALAKLGGDSIAEREEGMNELIELGPSCAAIVKSGYESPDAEVKQRSRSLLLKWVLGK